MKPSHSKVDGIEAEFDGVTLGDARLDARTKLIVSRIAAAPSDSFPMQMESVAEREALYRFLANPAVSLDDLLRGHVRQTHQRMCRYSVVRIVHDTTDFSFEGDRQGLGRITRGVRGFFAHTALAVGGDELREPLGVLGVRPHVLDATAVSLRGLTRSQRATLSTAKPRNDKLSSRWEKLAVDVARALPAGVCAIHVMDQEADDYALMAELQKADVRFVVRGDAGRLVHPGGASIANVLAARPACLFRSIAISARRPKAATRQHPARSERRASLVVRWGAISIRRGERVQSDLEELYVHAVHVSEPNAPQGEIPVEWMLFTSEAVQTLEEATIIVDHYRARWVIEEYFKALKTGCAFEKRQLTTLDALLRALGLFVPAAWQLLALRHLGRAEEPVAASAFFNSDQVLLLRAMLAKRNQTLLDEPTVRDLMVGIAALGGHIKNNGDPGWIVLGRGFMRFLEAEEGWALARRSDQS